MNNYIMPILTLRQRRHIRKDWNNLKGDIISWQDYLLKRANEIKENLL